MNNQLLKISLKFGLILGGINLLIGLYYSFTFNPDNLFQSNFLTGILNWAGMITLIAMAHYEFNQKNDNYIAFKDAILIGLIIIGISYVVSTTYYFISYEFILKEKMQSYYKNLSEHFGTPINENMFSISSILLSTIFALIMEIILLFILITAESHWKIFKKAGKQGWASIVPVYNVIVLLDIVKKPIWWLFMLFIPFVNIIFGIMIINALSTRFYKDEGFTLGLIFLPFVFYPLLGMSKAEYIEE